MRRTFFILMTMAFLLVGCSSNGNVLTGQVTHPTYSAFSDPESRLVLSGSQLNLADIAVHKTGWYSANGGAWQQFTLSGSAYGASTSWLSGSASYVLPSALSAPGEHYLIVYSCSRPSGSWDCHGNAGNPSGAWQLRVIIVAPSVAGTTYYVSSSAGNDAFNGTSLSSPWKTVAKVNAVTTFKPGDAILFKRGDTWREQLNVPSSGNAIHYLTFGAYGEGDKPLILGSTQATGWTVSNGRVWVSSTVVNDPYALPGDDGPAELFFVGPEGSVHWGVHKTSTSALAAEYDWTWILNRVYIYVPAGADPNSRYASVEVPQRNSAIFIDDHEYITIDGLEMRYVASRTIQTEYPQKDTTGLTIKNCKLSFVGSRFDTPTDGSYGYHLAVCRNNLLVQDNDISEAGRRDTSVHIYGSEGITISNITFEGNRLHDGYHSSGVGIVIDGWEDNNRFEDIIIRNNLIWDSPTRNPPVDGFSGNEMGSLRASSYEGGAVNLSIANIEVYNNIWMYPTQSCLWLDNADNASVHNNVFYDFNHNTPSPTNMHHIVISQGSTDIDIRNNIFYGTVNWSYNPYTPSVYLPSNQDPAEITIDNNLFFQADPRMTIVRVTSAGAWIDGYYRTTSWANIKTDRGWQLHEPGLLDPLFVDAVNGDFRLQEDSPAISAGFDVGLLTDYAGNHWLHPPSIGAFEYVPSVPAVSCEDGVRNGDETGVDCGGPACGACSTYARTFYVSNAGDDSLDGRTRATAWKTIAKVNSQSYQPGDAILFKRGDTWHESLVVGSSGNAAAPITFGAYGTGARPLFSGFTTISSWRSEGNNVYSAAVSTQSRPNMVTVNGKNTPMGRTPNTGFLTYEGSSGSYQACTLTDSQLSATPSWTGAEIVIRKNDWVLDPNPITAHNGQTISYYSSEHPLLGPINGNGYFFQDHRQTLDLFGEWHYNGSRLFMQFGTVGPTTYTVNVSSRDELVTISDSRYIALDSLYLQGANLIGVDITTFAEHVTVRNCLIDFSGGTAIKVQIYSHYANISGNVINNSNDGGISVRDVSNNVNIIGNRLLNTGTIPGMFGTWGARAISSSSDNALIQYNDLINTGYNGMQVSGNDVVIKNNLIDTYCTLLNDGGGIYTQDWTHTDQMTFADNIILNGVGNLEGTASAEDLVSAGIYLDSSSNNIVIVRNTIAHATHAGIKLSNIFDVTVRNNTFYDNTRQLEFLEGTDYHRIEGNDIQNNILVARTAAQSTLSYGSGYAEVSAMGTIDNNHYARPISDAQSLNIWRYPWNPYPWPTNPISLATWQTISSQDLHSRTSPKAITNVNDLRFEYNPTRTAKSITLVGSYVDAANKTYSGTVTLQPYTSLILIRN